MPPASRAASTITRGGWCSSPGPGGSERYLYGADDGLLAVADGTGEPRMIFLRLPTGIVGMIDFRSDPRGRIVCLHNDAQGNLVFAGSAEGELEGPFASDPYGLPLQPDGRAPYLYRGRVWHGDLGLYRIGCRWYDPSLRRFLTPDTYTGAPDDARLVNPFGTARGAADGARRDAGQMAAATAAAQPPRLLRQRSGQPLRPERPLELRRRPAVGARRAVDAAQHGVRACHRDHLPDRRGHALAGLGRHRRPCELADAGLRRRGVGPAECLRAGLQGRLARLVREPARHHLRQRVLRQRQVPGARGVAGAARSGDAAGLWRRGDDPQERRRSTSTSCATSNQYAAGSARSSISGCRCSASTSGTSSCTATRTRGSRKTPATIRGSDGRAAPHILAHRRKPRFRHGIVGRGPVALRGAAQPRRSARRPARHAVRERRRRGGRSRCN